MSERESDLDEKIELLTLNGLQYETPVSVSSVSSRVRTMIQMNPNQLLNYGAGDQLQIVLNTGAAYINGNTSTLNFAFRVNSGASGVKSFSFGFNGADADGDTFYNNGASVLNIFSDTLLNARSGELIAREQYRAQYASAIMHYNSNMDMRQLWGSLGGACLTTTDTGGAKVAFPIYAADKKIYFSIPLPLISSFFSSHALIPPQLLSGALLKLMLGNVKDAIKLYSDTTGSTLAASANGVSVDILDASIYLDQSVLYDSMTALINASASSLESSGLSYAYETYLGFKYPVSQNGTTINLDVLLSAAKVDKCIVKIVNVGADPSNAWINKVDHIGSASWYKCAGDSGVNVNKIGSGGGYQFRLGNETFPLYMVTNTADAFNQVVEAFQMGGFVWDDIDPLKTVNRPVNLAVSYPDYYRVSSDQTISGLGSGCNIIVQSLNKSQSLNVSGVSTNNSRQLTVQLVDFANLSNCVVYVYVPFLAVANASIDNCVVSR